MNALDDLVRDVALLSLDAGNTIVFFDHERVATFLRERGHAIDADALCKAEGETKRRHADGSALALTWARVDLPGARAWGGYVGNMLHAAGVASDVLPDVLDALWSDHVRLNLFSKVPAGLGEAVDALRARGVKVAVVSNSEGKLAELFAALGIDKHFDILLDSALVGFEKPHPRIFEVALERAGVAPTAALHLGDVISTDVVGARGVGMRAALIDPFGHYEGQWPDVPRVSGVIEIANAIPSLVRK